eukprot:6078416-Karenia_brevis.AAC.1
MCNAGDLPPLHAEAAVQAAHTFRTGVGLGWDKLHPRAVVRCSQEIIVQLVRVLVLAEVLGCWTKAFGITII